MKQGRSYFHSSFTSSIYFYILMYILNLIYIAELITYERSFVNKSCSQNRFYASVIVENQPIRQYYLQNLISSELKILVWNCLFIWKEKSFLSQFFNQVKVSFLKSHTMNIFFLKRMHSSVR